jgi:hypothetical protein
MPNKASKQSVDYSRGHRDSHCGHAYEATKTIAVISSSRRKVRPISVHVRKSVEQLAGFFGAGCLLGDCLLEVSNIALRGGGFPFSARPSRFD